MTTMNSARFTLVDALRMYQNLRERGRSETMARLSVQALCSEWSSDQRQELPSLFDRLEKGGGLPAWLNKLETNAPDKMVQ